MSTNNVTSLCERISNKSIQNVRLEKTNEELRLELSELRAELCSQRADREKEELIAELNTLRDCLDTTRRDMARTQRQLSDARAKAIKLRNELDMVRYEIACRKSWFSKSFRKN